MLEWFSQPEHWLAFAAVVAIVYFFAGGITFINCLKPIRGYFNIFRDERGKIRLRHLAFFCGCPLLLATATNLHEMVDDSILNIVGVIIAILTSTLYSFLSSIDSKYSEAYERKISYLEFSEFSAVHHETVDLISTEVVISIMLMILCFISPILKYADYVFFKTEYWILSVRSIISWLIYVCLYAFLLNLLMATKRFYVMVKKEM